MTNLPIALFRLLDVTDEPPVMQITPQGNIDEWLVSVKAQVEKTGVVRFEGTDANASNLLIDLGKRVAKKLWELSTNSKILQGQIIG